MRVRRLAVTVAAAAGILGASGTAVQAAPQGALARLDGETLRLRDGWGGAQACVVFAKAEVTCYGTAAEADRALGYSRAADPLVTATAARAAAAAAAIPSCASGWVCLFEHDQGRGRRLIFRDDYEQDLGDYAFDNQVSSWRNNQSGTDFAFMRDYDAGGPESWEAISLSARSYSSNVGTKWNDRADSIEA